MDLQHIRRTARRHPVLDRLPARAVAIIDKLIADRETAAATTRGLLDQRQELRDRASDARRIVSEYEKLQRAGGMIRETPLPTSASGGRGFVRAPDEARLEQARKDLTRAESELRRLDEMADSHAGRRAALDTLLQRLGRWLDSLPAGAAIGEWKPRGAITLPKGKTAAEAVDTLRGELAALRATRAEIEASPLPAAHCKALAQSQIAALAAAGAPDVFGLIEAGAPVRWPQIGMAGTARVVGEGTAAGGYADVQGTDPVATMAWLFQQQIVEAIERQTDECADDSNALTPKERQGKLAAIDAEILSVERSEIAFVEMAADAVMHRADVDPRALLQIHGPAPRSET